MAFVCVDDGQQRVYFDTANVVDLIEPVDAPNGKKPAGWWCDEGGGAIRVGSVSSGVTTIVFPQHVWPMVKVLCGITDRTTVVMAKREAK